jgi:hypothetical protein
VNEGLQHATQWWNVASNQLVLGRDPHAHGPCQQREQCLVRRSDSVRIALEKHRHELEYVGNEFCNTRCASSQPSVKASTADGGACKHTRHLLLDDQLERREKSRLKVRYCGSIGVGDVADQSSNGLEHVVIELWLGRIAGYTCKHSSLQCRCCCKKGRRFNEQANYTR